MIKVCYLYKTKTSDLEELFEKFKQSANKEFATPINNTGIKMFKRVEGEYTFVLLDIYYNNLTEYNERKKFEKNSIKWNNIWFNENNKHQEISVTIYDVMEF